MKITASKQNASRLFAFRSVQNVRPLRLIKSDYLFMSLNKGKKKLPCGNKGGHPNIK